LIIWIIAKGVNCVPCIVTCVSNFGAIRLMTPKITFALRSLSDIQCLDSNIEIKVGTFL